MGKGLERTRNEEWLKDLGILGRRPGAMINAENCEGFLQRMLSKLTCARVCTVFLSQASREQTCHWKTVSYRETVSAPSKKSVDFFQLSYKNMELLLSELESG